MKCDENLNHEILGQEALDAVDDEILEEDAAITETAQNEQAGLSTPSKEETSLDDLFAMAAKKQDDVMSDPFSAFLNNDPPKSVDLLNDMVVGPTSGSEPVKTEVKETEVGGTGGGWGDDDDDIDLDD